MIWSKEETLTRAEMEALQLARLQETVARVYERVPYYRAKMDGAGVQPSDIKSLADLQKLPFTTKQDMRDTYPFGLFAVPKEEVVRIHASSGTTGKPTVVGYTQNDLEIWTDCVSRIACMGGASKTDVAQICFGYGMFTGAFGLHYGLEKIGATIVPSSTGNSEKQLMYMQDFQTSLLVATPSYALRLAEVAKQNGIDPKTDLSIKIALVGSELLTDAMREEMHAVWGENIKITSNYGMSELMGPGVSGECLEHCGMHINEDYFLPEIINSETGEVLPAGEKGELVITCIKKEGLPLIRYRTRDIASLNNDPCPCGRTTVKLNKITGRSDDMLIIRGVNVFPSQIESVLLKNTDVAPHYHINVDRVNNLDTMEIVVELSPSVSIDEVAHVEEIRRKLTSDMTSALSVSAKITLVSPGTVARSEGKAKRISDFRKL